MPVQSFTIDTQCVEGRYASVHVVRDLDGARTFLHDWLLPRKDQWIGFDTETNAVDPWFDGYKLRALQFADNHETWVLDAQRLGPLATQRIVSSHHNLVAHFSENELKFTERAAPGSIDLTNDRHPHLWDNQVPLAYYDPRTVMTEHSKPGIDPRLVHAKGLKPTSVRELSPALAQTEAEFDQWAKDHAPTGFKTGDKLKSWKFGNVPFDEPVYQTYAAMDPLFTIRLWHKELAEVNRRNQWGVVEADLRLQWDIDRMLFRGLPVDAEYAHWVDEQLYQKIQRNAVLLNHYGIGESGMGPRVGEVLEAMGAVSEKINKDNGNRQYDKEVLQGFAKYAGPVGDLARTVISSRQSTKFRSAYVQPMIMAVMYGDGRVHASFRAIGTTTGRSSAARPPLQQMPKESTLVRGSYGCPPGWVFVTCDMKTGEPRTMAARSGDPRLIADIYGGDINGAIAAIAHGQAYVPAEGKTPGTDSYKMRKKGKIGFLAGCYGASNRKVDISADVEPGTNLMDRWRDAYRVAFARGDRLNREPYLMLDSGRVCWLWDRYHVNDRDEMRLDPNRPSRLALNYDTQGSQRDILYRAWATMREWGWAQYLALFVHDEIVLLVPEELAEAAAAALQAAMTFDIGNGMMMESEATIEGRTWGRQNRAFTEEELEFDDDL